MAVNDERSASTTDLQEIKATLARIENGGRGERSGGMPPWAPATMLPPSPIDPTLNVKEALAKDEAHRKEIREIDQHYREEIRRIQERCTDELSKAQSEFRESEKAGAKLAQEAEKGRIDALRAVDAATVASALVTVTNTASTLATTAAATKDVQDKAIVALQLIASSSGGTLTGREAQQAQGRQGSQFLITVTISIAALFLGGSVYFGLSSSARAPAPTPVTVTVIAPSPTAK